ncbi:MAG: hypothetical protein JRE43_00385 [Deltaproteobacteria bacterium]|jgi:hypothetical protein|nr:hypothetical protein [Deltaproteobacteria bacterium]MBW2542565.1 hypothetical protein [Deltaproteobacteria bacterium]
MKHEAERSQLNPEERAFVDGLAAHYAPPPWDSAQRVRFDAALQQRLDRPRRRGFLVPALAGAAVVALIWFSFSPGPQVDPARPVAASAWESELFLSSDLSPLDDRDESEALPDDYLAIASFFLDG